GKRTTDRAMAATQRRTTMPISARRMPSLGSRGQACMSASIKGYIRWGTRDPGTPVPKAAGWSRLRARQNLEQVPLRVQLADSIGQGSKQRDGKTDIRYQEPAGRGTGRESRLGQTERHGPTGLDAGDPAGSAVGVESRWEVDRQHRDAGLVDGVNHGGDLGPQGQPDPRAEQAIQHQVARR